MKKKVFYLLLLAFVGSMGTQVYAKAEVESEETVRDYVEKYLGCNGGEMKCFTGELSFKGISVSGTWYQH